MLEALRTGIPIAPVTLFSAGFYGVLFVISGLMVSHLMRTSGAVVARREQIGAPAPAVQRARLERWLGAVPAPEAPTSLEEAIDLALAPPAGAPAGGAASTAYPV